MAESDDMKAAGSRIVKGPIERKTSPVPTLLAAALCMSLLVFLFEILEQAMFPNIRIWQTHALTITFSGVIASVIAWFVLRADERAKEAMRKFKEMDRRLAETLDFNRKIISDLPVGIVIFKASGECVIANEAAARIVHGTVAQMLKQNFRQIESWRASGLLEMAEETLATKESRQGEFHFVSTFDKELSLVIHLSYFFRNHEPHLLFTVHDIIQREQAEAALAHERSLLHTLIDNLPDCIYAKDDVGRKILANPADLKNLHCKTEAEAFGKTDFDLFPKDIAERFWADDQAVIHGQPVIDREEYFLNDAGEKRWLLTSKLPLRDQAGKTIGLVGIGRDITRRKEAEEHVRQQAALLDKAQDAILVVTADDHRIIYWNKSAERIYGWTAAEAVGKSAVELLYRGVVTPQLANTIKTVNERGEWVGELQESTKDGKMVTIQGRYNLLRDEQCRPKSRLIINTDITARKNLEIQFLRSQRMEGIGALASGIAHDLNNVLTPLLVSVQVLKEKVTDEDGRKLLQALEANVQRGAGLVKQVLVFGRGVSGERIPVNLKHIVREIKQIVYETFPKSVEFEFRAVPDLWTVTGDPTQLHQVLLNLCINARDAMPKGGKLSIRMENMIFDENYASMNPEAKVGPFMCIVVTDTGTGIPREIQDKIFDPFFTTKEPGKGTGLGLSTTLTIVKNHGGFIHCHSTPGKGSQFEVYFPANISRAGEDKAITEVFRLPRGHDELVLVVDDEEPIRQITQKTLERFGYRVLLAANGAEAVSLYRPRQQEISAVITDMVMPIMDGPTTIAALKTINPDVKIITSSGLASYGGMAKARNAGVRYFIPKPYTAATVLNTLHEVLNGKQ